MRRTLATVIMVVLGFQLALPAGELRLGRYYTDGMVLQREQSNTLRGFADAGTAVTVAFAGQSSPVRFDQIERIAMIGMGGGTQGAGHPDR